MKTNKDRLYNDLIQLMELGVKWNDPNAYAVPFLKKLCEILWYIDGTTRPLLNEYQKYRHYSPDMLGTIALISISTVKEHWKIYVHPKCMLTLQDMLQASWFQKESFTRLKEATEGLNGVFE